jgi:thioredoxin-like negative regulator of GroEL
VTTTDVFPRADQSTGQKPKLLFFHSLRSGPSRRAEGYLAQVLQRGHNHDTFQLHRIAQEESPELAERLRIVTLPTFLIVEGKAIRGRLEQPRSAKAIEQFLLPWLGASEAPRRPKSIPT